MDRFMEGQAIAVAKLKKDLKSNMDRFMAYKQKTIYIKLKFKIQYGQIYGPKGRPAERRSKIFKIQYGQIYGIHKKVKKNFKKDLKSNMDRFMVSYLHSKTTENPYLKSNMDRFMAKRFDNLVSI